MKNARNNEIVDRRTASADAKAALLEAYRTAKTAADPDRMARQAERTAIATAREERRIERERVKLEDQKRMEADAAERQAAAEAAGLAEQARIIEDEEARKAERDRRYANRKARKA